jgi:excisionase family DNA binding protein
MKKPVIFHLETLMTAKEVCDVLRISRRTLRRWCHTMPPRMPYIMLSRNKVAFRRQMVEYFIEKREIM